MTAKTSVQGWIVSGKQEEGGNPNDSDGSYRDHEADLLVSWELHKTSLLLSVKKEHKPVEGRGGIYGSALPIREDARGRDFHLSV